MTRKAFDSSSPLKDLWRGIDMIQVKIDDSQIKKFIDKSPQRANWALREALSMAGGHYREVLKQNIRHGRIGGPQGLHPLSKSYKKPFLSQKTPL